MAYRVDISPRAASEFRSLTKATQRRLQPHIDALAETPRPPGITKLSGTDDLYRLRVGDYRIIYRIDDDVLHILVVMIGHRRDIYRRLP